MLELLFFINDDQWDLNALLKSRVIKGYSSKIVLESLTDVLEDRVTSGFVPDLDVASDHIVDLFLTTTDLGNFTLEVQVNQAVGTAFLHERGKQDTAFLRPNHKNIYLRPIPSFCRLQERSMQLTLYSKFQV